MTAYRHYPRVAVDVTGVLQLPAPVAALAEAYWEALMRDGRPFTRGPVLHAVGMTDTGGLMRVAAEWTDYAHLMASRAGLLPAPWRSHPVFGAALVVTADNALVVGRMNGETASPGRWQLPGGGAEPADTVNGRLDVRRLVGRELAEELGVTLTQSEVTAVEPLGAMLAPSGAGGLGLLVHLSWPFERVAERFDAWSRELESRGEAPEFTAVARVDPDGVTVGPLAPTTRAWVEWWQARVLSG
jgi:8-oxo-dGTP pyrophosphatase MutT (NUDIX family)